MVDFITGVFLVYSFVAFYFSFMFLLIYIQNRKDFFHYPLSNKNYSLSVVVPCYNEEKEIGGCIESLLQIQYQNIKKIIVVDDCSTDNSFKIMKEYERRYPGRVLAVQTPRNTGNAAGAKNYGARFVETELIGFTDADSYPLKDSVEKMVGFFDDAKVGAVTSTVLVKNRNNFIEKLQAIEYKVIKFSRKLLEFIDAIYVTPGPLAVYRKSAFDDIGGFDEKNLTEDIEITWHMQSKGYKIKMAVPSRVYSVAPSKFGAWMKQRNRWNIGGLQTIFKYRKDWFRKGMLGNFILPFFVFSWLLGIFGIFILGYRIFRTVVINYLSTKYSVEAQTAILALRDVNLTPNVLAFFGLLLFILGMFFTFVALANVKEKDYKKTSVLNLGFYMFFYLLMYPVIQTVSIYKFLKGKGSSW